MTNNVKAQIIVAVNSVLSLLVLLGVPLSQEQQAGVAVAVNAILGAYVALTYKNSPKRVPDGIEVYGRYVPKEK